MAPRSVASRYRCEHDTSRVKRRPRWEADYMSERSTDQKKLADAAQPLFATLDDQQKKRFTENLIRINNKRDAK
jgi:hypothetical protein